MRQVFMARILILNGHPHDDPDHFVHALARAYQKEAEICHTVQRIDLAKLDIPILRDPVDFQSGTVPEQLKNAQEAIKWAEHIVLLFPLWLGGMPALLKAFLEQIARPGFAIENLPNGRFKKLLKGRSARVVITMGMPAFAYRFYFRGHSMKELKRNILGFVGFSPVRVTLIGSVETSESGRHKALRKVARLGWRGL